MKIDTQVPQVLCRLQHWQAFSALSRILGLPSPLFKSAMSLRIALSKVQNMSSCKNQPTLHFCYQSIVCKPQMVKCVRSMRESFLVKNIAWRRLALRLNELQNASVAFLNLLHTRLVPVFNKLASLEATLVRNYDRPTDPAVKSAELLA